MAYITRELERKFLKLNDFFKVILVTGARQVGKTTMLKHLAGSDRTYVTMDNTMARELAQSDPVLFFQTYKPPILIDEVQKAPELFEQIKIICDESNEKGLIWLTGSQQYNMMKRVRETLAGRIGILELYGLSAREKAGLVFDTDLDFSVTKNPNPYCTQMGLKRACGAFLSPLRWSAERRTTTPVPSSEEGDYGERKQIL